MVLSLFNCFHSLNIQNVFWQAFFFCTNFQIYNYHGELATSPVEKTVQKK
jgi:hypothetical protein